MPQNQGCTTSKQAGQVLFIFRCVPMQSLWKRWQHGKYVHIDPALSSWQQERQLYIKIHTFIALRLKTPLNTKNQSYSVEAHYTAALFKSISSFHVLPLLHSLFQIFITFFLHFLLKQFPLLLVLFYLLVQSDCLPFKKFDLFLIFCDYAFLLFVKILKFNESFHRCRFTHLLVMKLPLLSLPYF